MKIWEYIAIHECNCTVPGESIEKYIELDANRVMQDVYKMIKNENMLLPEIMRILPPEIQNQIKPGTIYGIINQDVNYFIPKVIRGGKL